MIIYIIKINTNIIIRSSSLGSSFWLSWRVLLAMIVGFSPGVDAAC
jgi:hypothetical protein